MCDTSPPKNRYSYHLLNEDCMSLAQAARSVPPIRGHKPPVASTLFRWFDKGRKTRSGKQRVHLEICRVGGTNCTSRQALARFLDALNDVEPINPPAGGDQARLEKRADQAMRVLRRRGLITKSPAEGRSEPKPG